MSLLVLAVALGLAGCSVISKLADTREVVQNAGVSAGDVNLDTANGLTTLRVQYTTLEETTEDQRAEMDRVARAIWREAPVGFDQLTLSATGGNSETGNNEILTRSFRRSALQEAFGPRPAGLEGDTGEDLLRSVLLFAVLILFGLAGLIALIVALVLRSRRHHPPAPVGPARDSERVRRGCSRVCRALSRAGLENSASGEPTPKPGVRIGQSRRTAKQARSLLAVPVNTSDSRGKCNHSLFERSGLHGNSFVSHGCGHQGIYGAVPPRPIL